jgi:CelD/BcsL family acetyltransferase involved in cellulose biosynthesis
METVQLREWTVTAHHDLASIRPIWDALYEATPDSGPFMSWDYAAQWWTHFGKSYTPMLLVAERHTEPCGRVLLPLMREGSELRWFSTPGPDRVALLRDHPEDIPEALQALAEYLGNRRWSKLSLSYLNKQDADQIVTSFGDFPHRQDDSTGSPYIAIDGRTWEDYRMSLSHSRRADMRAVLRKLEHAEMTVRFETAIDAPGVERLFPVMQALTLAGPMPEKHALVTGEQGAFLHDLLVDYASRQWVQLTVMYLDDTAIAYSICFTMNGITGYWRADYDGHFQEYSPGKLLLYHLIEASFDAHDKTFDFMQGLERYKMLWTNDVQPLSYLIYYRNALHGQIAQLKARLAERAEHS